MTVFVVVVVVCVYVRACVRVCVCVCYSKNVVADHVMLGVMLQNDHARPNRARIVDYFLRQNGVERRVAANVSRLSLH